MVTARPRVKVCGHTRQEDITASVAAGVDAVGVITEVPVDTPRAVSLNHAAELLGSVPPFVTSVLVTMPPDVETAITLLDRTTPDVLQLHPNLDPEQINRLADRVDTTLVITVDPTDTNITAYQAAADALLVDSVTTDGAGGTGETHDWTKTRDLVAELSVPVVLAGGLTPDNVATAVSTVKPYGVDVASGVEITGGQKDHDAVAAFVQAATTEGRYP